MTGTTALSRAKIRALEMPRCCAGHECDECGTCRRGHCCRTDNPHYRLPSEGEWEQPFYGRIGVLVDDGVKVECHVCGGWYVGLGNHVWGAHDLTADEYRAIFGLAWDSTLVGPDLKKLMSRHTIERQAWLNLPRIEWTTEQRRYWRKRRTVAAESKTRMADGVRARTSRHACRVCGQEFTRVARGAHVQTCSDACSEALRKRVNEQKRGPRAASQVVTRCEVCGTPMRVNRWRLEHSLAGRTCCAGHASVLAARTRAQQLHPLTQRPRSEPQPCNVCGELAKPLRRGRCHACNEFFRRHGVDAVFVADAPPHRRRQTRHQEVN